MRRTRVLQGFALFVSSKLPPSPSKNSTCYFLVTALDENNSESGSSSVIVVDPAETSTPVFPVHQETNLELWPKTLKMT